MLRRTEIARHRHLGDRMAVVTLCPTAAEVVPVPKHIAATILGEYASGALACNMGADFFNATFHFADRTGQHIQTTLPAFDGSTRHATKQAGYRDVRLIDVDRTPVFEYGVARGAEPRFCVGDGWREDGSVKSFPIPDDCIVDMRTAVGDAESEVRWYCSADSTPDRGIHEIDSRAWLPYTHDATLKIETAFQADEPRCSVDVFGTEYEVSFLSGCYAVQSRGGAERLVMRKLVAKGASLVPALPENVSATSPPAAFLCPILHTLMEDPVTTSDGFTYERSAVSKWLADHDRSPMTNLPLETKDVVPNHALAAAIKAWRAPAS